MAPKRTKYHLYLLSYLQLFELWKFCKYSKLGTSEILRYPLSIIAYFTQMQFAKVISAYNAGLI